MRIAINGAGVAGPALARWLVHSGHEVLLVERAPALRRGGYLIDFWGIGFDLAEKMGITPRLMELGYRMREVRFVDAEGRRRGGFDVGVFDRMANGRYTSVRRSDVSASIYETIADRVETLFGDSIAAIDTAGNAARIEFEHAPSREVDLVVGADGLHSRVREIAFGPEDRFEHSLGYHVAAFETTGYRPRDELAYVGYTMPGRQLSRVALREDRTMFLFVVADECLDGAMPAGRAAQKAALRHAFAGGGWECAAILDAMDRTEELYFDRVSQIRMDAWAKRRVALIGDAAACVSLVAGEGTGLAIAEAYVLAGELWRANGDIAAALMRYQDRLMPFVAGKQRGAAKFASSFAPKTRFGIAFRNAVTRLMHIGPIADAFVGRAVRDDIELPDYGLRDAA